MLFTQKLEKISNKNNSLVCVGLDPEKDKLPKHFHKRPDPFFEFNKAIIAATHDLVCAFKPQIAFYEAEGPKGLRSLKKTIEYLQRKHPLIPTIIDMKRGDIGNTAKMYARAAFEYWRVDAITAFPKPFLEYKDKYIFFLVKTSNPDAKMFQDVQVGKKPFYLYLAQKIKKWKGKNVGVFVGATYPKELAQIRQIFPRRPILTAGIGAQGGEAKKAIRAGVNKQGLNLVCNAARSIIYADSSSSFAQAARKQALLLKNTINQYRRNA
jgi:orotidine 5'-phosphate decarboxylase subfamily 2